MLFQHRCTINNLGITIISFLLKNEVMVQRVKGHYAVRNGCQVRSQNLTTFPLRLHHAFQANMSS